MPRRRKTETGAPAQAAVAPKGGTYGTGEAALESQRRIPLPAGPTPVPGMSGGAPGGGPAPQSAGAQQVGGTDAAALAAAQAMPAPQSMIDMPTERPGEPIQTGFGDQQPGLNPDPALFELRALAQKYPYPDLLRFIERAQREA